MTVIKRNGSEVTFDITKIIAAITKANESVDESIRMTPMQIQRIAESVEFSCRKSTWCRLAWKDSNLFIIWNCSGAYYMVPNYTDGIRSVDWFVRYNDGHIGRSVYYPEYQDS